MGAQDYLLGGPHTEEHSTWRSLYGSPTRKQTPIWDHIGLVQGYREMLQRLLACIKPLVGLYSAYQRDAKGCEDTW